MAKRDENKNKYINNFAFEHENGWTSGGKTVWRTGKKRKTHRTMTTTTTDHDDDDDDDDKKGSRVFVLFCL